MKLFRSEPGSTARLLQYSLSYFFFYVIFGVGVKYFQGSAADGFPGLSELEFLTYSTLGSSLVCLGVILFARWWKFPWKKSEIFFMVLSGTCTALVIPTTTLMYSLPISVMVAMVLMRGSIIVISRLVDSVLLLQGLSKKKVIWEENIAMLFSLLAVGLYLFFARESDFDFVHSKIAMGILVTYILAYALRIYIMNLFKFTRTAHTTSNNKNYFAIEQLTASIWIFGFSAVVAFLPSALQSLNTTMITNFHETFSSPHPAWMLAAIAGLPFGFAAFFSVFLFMFEGRTSTFAGLVNRLASLLAGTFSTLFFALAFGGKWPGKVDWLAFACIIIAVLFLGLAERKKQI